jgi:tetratricopeptide (TPR) repeat protein
VYCVLAAALATVVACVRPVAPAREDANENLAAIDPVWCDRRSDEPPDGATNSDVDKEGVRPGSAEEYWRRGRVHHRRGLVQNSAEDLRAALEEYSRALDLAPAECRILSDRAAVYLALRRWGKAIGDANSALAANRGCASALFVRGRAVGLTNDEGARERAIADLTEAVHIEPRLSAAYLERGILLERQGDASGALADFTRHIEAGLPSAKAYYLRGCARHDEGSYATAIEDFTNALGTGSESAVILLARGLAQFHGGDQSAASRDFARVAEFEALDVTRAYTATGWAYGRDDELDRVLAALEIAAKVLPDNPDIHYHRGSALFARGRLDAAVGAFSSAIDRAPGHVRALLFRGTLLQIWNKSDEARRDLARVIELEPDGTHGGAARTLLNRPGGGELPSGIPRGGSRE